MQIPTSRTLLRAWAVLVLISVPMACTSDDDSPLDPSDFEFGPIVLHSSEGTEPTTIVGIAEERSIYVNFGDPDGFDDLSTAILSVGTIRILDVVARDFLGPDDLGGNCNGTGPNFERELEFDFAALLPDSASGFGPIPIAHEDGFVDVSEYFCMRQLCTRKLIPDVFFQTADEALGAATESGCNETLALVGVYPPLRNTPSDVIVSSLVVEIVDLEVTIFDAAGASVTWAPAPFRIAFGYPQESSSGRP